MTGSSGTTYFAAGCAAAGLLFAYKALPGANPSRVFKLATKTELAKFQAEKRICSGLDQADGFIHLSDETAVRKVAKLFFSETKDLVLIEIASGKFEDASWERDANSPDKAETPSAAVLGRSKTLVHFLHNDGCVHVYGKPGVSWGTVVRHADVPLTANGHVFPEWL